MRWTVPLGGLVLCFVVGCDAGASAGADSGARDASREPCTADIECDDGRFCTGMERCSPGAAGADERGCVATASPCVAGACDETGDRCTGDCADADGDGVSDASCGGSDCDDTDARRHPGAVEVCDVDGVDEDCDPSTYGFRDLDGDGDVSSACCNGAVCGADCDDMRPGTNPRVPEVCDGLDNDCDRTVDEGVFRAAYADADGDGYGDPTAPVMAACGAAGDGADNGLDCDDTDATVRPGAAEACNGRDDNCDGVYDADVDGDGHLSPRAVCVGDELPRDDCNDLDPDTHLGAVELCDLRDNDCDGDIDDREDADLSCRVDGVSAGYCFLGQCRLASCEEGRADCDGRGGNGCETSLAADPANCGACGERCGYGTACVLGSCQPVRVVDVDIGTAHACFVTELGRVGCFGRNLEGQLGSGASTYIEVPVEVPDLSDAVSVDVGARESCALREEGHLSCWGAGEGAERAPDPSFTASSLSISDEGSWACATGSDRHVWCWGYGLAEPLGQWATDAFDTGLLADGAETSTSVTCMRDAAGALTCRGMNLSSQLGDGLADHGRMCQQVFTSPFGGPQFPLSADCSVTPVRVSGLSGVLGHSVSADHGCAHDGRRVWCWGAYEGTSSSSTPVTVLTAPAATSVVSVDTGLRHSCAVLGDGSAYCWGQNGAGELGDGTRTSRTTPTRVVGGSFDLVSAGLGASCGIDRDGELSCWGLGGNGIEALRDVPAPVIGLDPGTVTAGSEIEMCARTRSGRVVCWGRLRTAPERIAGLEGVVELTGGVMGMCARTGEGEVWCWNGADAPARVSLPAAARVAVGTGHACAVLRDGGVRCWGDNRRGQLGDGSTASSLVPVEVVGAEDALEVALGAEHTCARLASGRVLCWGDNDAVQLGQSGLAGSSVPVAVPVIDDAAQIAAGAQHTCAIRSDGSVACWGDDDYGQLGDGAVFGSGLGPRTALGIEDVRGLSTGARHTCALLASAAVWCWGSNERGESGQPLSRAVDVPTRVQGVSARALGSAQQTTCATELGSGLSCWGSNRWGELGDITGDRCQILCLPDSCRETDCGRPEPTRVLGI